MDAALVLILTLLFPSLLTPFIHALPSTPSDTRQPRLSTAAVFVKKLHYLAAGQEDDDTSATQSQPLPRDAFKIRQLQKAQVTSSRGGGGSLS